MYRRNDGQNGFKAEKYSRLNGQNSFTVETKEQTEWTIISC